jgi:hypothetical protein
MHVVVLGISAQTRIFLQSGEDGYSMRSPATATGTIRQVNQRQCPTHSLTQLIIRTAFVYCLLVKFTDGVLMMVSGGKTQVSDADVTIFPYLDLR